MKSAMMKKLIAGLLFLGASFDIVRAGDADLFPYSALQAVDAADVAVEDAFWSPRIRIIQQTTLPLLLDLAEKQGKIDNFRIVAGLKAGKLRLYNAPDSDVYKLLEAAGLSLGESPCPALKARCDSIIAVIVAAQDSSGYLHTQYMLDFDHPAAPSPTQKNVKTFGFGPANRWRSLKSNWPFAYSQLYCAGHMMEAGAAYYEGTGERALLDAAIRFADLICRVFDESRIRTYADHPEVEIGLMKLYALTGEARYRECAERMCRHINFSRPVDLHPEENSKPLAEQRCAYGHCVRTAYLYTGAAEVVRAAGCRDLSGAMDRLWASVVGGKMYLHGGTGNGTNAEQHGEKYDLPIEPAYCECCASIAQAQWNHAMNLLKGDAEYASLVELEMYNNALAGISLDGRRFFYSNKLNIGTENRKNRHSGVRETYLFCCPSKLPVFVAGVGRWIYAKDGAGIYVNQYVGSRLRTQVGRQTVAFRQISDYVRAGTSRIEFESGGHFVVHLRVPQWLKRELVPHSPYRFGSQGAVPGYTVRLNGHRIEVAEDSRGYLTLERDWKAGDRLDIRFEVEVRRIYTDDSVAANRGRVALMRGPLLYCLEGIDNGCDVRSLVIPASAEIRASKARILTEKTVILKGACLRNGQPGRFVAIPYFMWENRGISSMVLLPVEDPTRINKEHSEEASEYNTYG